MGRVDGQGVVEAQFFVRTHIAQGDDVQPQRPVERPRLHCFAVRAAAVVEMTQRVAALGAIDDDAIGQPEQVRQMAFRVVSSTSPGDMRRPSYAPSLVFAGSATVAKSPTPWISLIRTWKRGVGHGIGLGSGNQRQLLAILGRRG